MEDPDYYLDYIQSISVKETPTPCLEYEVFFLSRRIYNILEELFRRL